MENNTNIKFNSIENADAFLKYNLEFAKLNNILNFTIWSNGTELQAVVDDNDIATTMQRGELKYKGYWKAFIWENGHQVSTF